jgi:uncharacterized protein YjbI with pentapeptide repeats
MTGSELACAKSAVAALERAIAIGDETAILLASARARVALAAIERSVGTNALDVGAMWRLVATAAPLLERTSAHVHGIIAGRQLRALSNTVSLDRFRRADGIVDASGEVLDGITIADRELARCVFAGAYLRDVSAIGAQLDDADASLAVLVRFRLGAGSMRNAKLDASLMESCDFERANLDRSDWRSATAFGSTFSGGVLSDTQLGGALFVECDLRGADLRTINLGPHASAAGAVFARCDLRESIWCGRDLDGVTMIDCKLHGVHGTPHVRGVRISRPDLSLRGDGTVIGGAAEVIARWSRSC